METEQQQYLDVWSRSKRAENLLPPDDQLKPTLMQRVQQIINQLISGLDPSKLALFVDVSHWNGDIDLAPMVRDGKIAMLSPKCGDGKQVRNGSVLDINTYIDDKFYQNVQKAYDAGIPCMPYFYVQVKIEGYTVKGTIDWNMEVLKAALGKLKAGVSYHALCLDVEELGVTDYNGSDIVLGMIERIGQDPEFSKVPLVIYSSMRILNVYTKLRDQLSFPGRNANLWLAQWIFTTSTTCTWADFWSVWVPRIDMRVMTPGWAGWWAVQAAACFKLPGTPGALDVSFACRTKEKFWEWLKYKGTVTPPPPPPPPPPAGEFDWEKLRTDGHANWDKFIDAEKVK